MKRRAKVWMAVAAALCVVIAVMASITSTLLETERAAVEATTQAVTEERVRLALWRLDSTIPGRVSREMARVALLADSPAPAPELPPTPEVRGRFVRTADGQLRWLTPPEAPVQDAITLALQSNELSASLEVDRIVDIPRNEGENVPADTGYYGSPKSRSAAEFQKRASSVRDNLGSIATVQEQQNQTLLNSLGNVSSKLPALPVGSKTSNGSTAPLPDGYRDIVQALEDERASLASAQLGPVMPMWVGDELILARRVRRGEEVEVHGAWMNWPKMRDDLLAEVGDLFPAPTLVPEFDPSDENTARLLATLPVRLDPGALPPAPTGAFSPVRASILLGWTAVLLGTGTLIALLLWSMALSERRAAFVSTVTHELRTPLTTFRMYTEMLGEKMVEEKRDRYIATLRTEAERLGHLVENVLAYARIERDRAERSRETLSVENLIERVTPHLEDRCKASDTALKVAIDEGSGARTVAVDAAAIEQVLLNLVDNAAKYAPTREDAPAIVLETVADRRHIRIAVRDHGPGIPAGERRKIFEPFTKATRDEAGTKPGVGLGLALCRRLARAHGGDLTVEDASPGARFVLSLPAA